MRCPCWVQYLPLFTTARRSLTFIPIYQKNRTLIFDLFISIHFTGATLAMFSLPPLLWGFALPLRLSVGSVAGNL